MTTENLFKTVFEMQPRDTGSSGGQTVTREEKVIGNDYYILNQLHFPISQDVSGWQELQL